MYNLIYKNMAKIYGLQGVLTGKLGNSVMAVRNGEQIVRQYQPIVANPSTQAQISARARLKLMSQMSAVMAPVIAIRRSGIVSSRNLFVKKNYKASTYSNDTASIDLNAVQLTDSVLGLGDFSATRGEGTAVAVSVSSVGINRAVFAAFVKQPDSTLRLSETIVVSEVTGGNFQGSLALARTREYVVYAYGVRDNTEAAKAIFGSMEAVSAEQIAKLVTSRTLLESDVTLTETKAITLPIPQTNNSRSKE